MQKDVFSKLTLNFLKELRELQINFHLVSDVIKIKRKIMSEYQLEIYTVLIYTVFLLLMLKLYLRLELKLKKILRVLEFNQSQLVITIF